MMFLPDQPADQQAHASIGCLRFYLAAPRMGFNWEEQRFSRANLVFIY
jgi:hypothetical protein